MAQVVKRLAEAASCKKLSTPVNVPSLLLSNPHCRGPLPDGNDVLFEAKQYRTAVLDPWRLTTRAPNNCVFINDGTIVCIQNVMQVGDDVEIVGFRFLEPEPLLESPFDANGVLQTYRVNTNLISPLISYPIENVKCKAYAIPMSWQLYDFDEEAEETSHFAIFPLLMEDKYR